MQLFCRYQPSLSSQKVMATSVFLLLLLFMVVGAQDILNVGSMHIYTDSLRAVGEQTRGTSPLERQASVTWGAHAFNTRNATLVPELATAPYMSGCNVQLNLTFFDIGNTQEGAIQAYRNAYLFAEVSEVEPRAKPSASPPVPVLPASKSPVRA